MSQNNNEELYHHGVIGMKWGVRRYQNKDGSLTPKGLKRYSKMSPDKLNKTIKKEVHKARKKNGERTGWSNQWIWDNYIGENSKKEINRHYKQIRKINDSTDKKYKDFVKKTKNLDEFDPKVEKKYDNIYDIHDQKMKDIGATMVYGQRYSEKAIKNIGKINIGFLRDLGYNQETSKYLQNKLSKSKRVAIY